MIRSIEALRYRCLRYVRQEIEPFQVLVGPNGSGKSTFLDVVGLIGDLLKSGLAPAIRERAPNFFDLVWMGDPSARLELAVEVEVPLERLARLPQNGSRRARYELAIGLGSQRELSILGETLWLKSMKPSGRLVHPQFFPAPPEPAESLISAEGQRAPAGWKKVVAKTPESGNDYFFSETTDWNNPFRLGPQKLALANLPEDEERFPVAIWIKRFLMEGVQLLVLNSEAMRRPAPPGSPTEFQPDGSNLPWAIEELRKRGRHFERWLDHVRTALPDIEDIETVEREEDRHRYLRITYKNGLKAPSWTVSDGTLRLLALTLVGYLEGAGRIYLIEEPENGIHPQAVETVFQSLSSAYGNQILCATHSPVFLAMAEPEQVLCFAQDGKGATDIVRGSEHPNLKDWKRSTDLGTLFATGILG
ncbi:MAG TPA: AAA family ATPase [Thermoanaerobaculia bacterium]|nr:AAA family ATPase [Thermoanaerobaculia bacterium]